MTKKELKQIIADQQKYIKLLENKVSSQVEYIPTFYPLCNHEIDYEKTIPSCKKCGHIPAHQITYTPGVWNQ